MRHAVTLLIALMLLICGTGAAERLHTVTSHAGATVSAEPRGTNRVANAPVPADECFTCWAIHAPLIDAVAAPTSLVLRPSTPPIDATTFVRPPVPARSLPVCRGPPTV